jgi:hypothetical protein
MTEDPTDTMTDSTGNSHDLTLYNMDSGNLQDGTIAKEMAFNGTNEYMTTADHDDFDVNTLTVEAILDMPGDLTGRSILHHGDNTVGGNQGQRYFIKDVLKLGLSYYSGDWREVLSDETLTANQDAYIAIALDASNMYPYIDGVAGNTKALPAGLPDTSYPVYVGAGKIGASPGAYMKKKMDEVRYSKITRPAAWIKATCYTLFDNFITFGELGPSTSGVYYFAGTVYEGISTISGAMVYVYRRDTGAYLGSTTSSGDGGFYVETTFSGSHFLVCLDPAGGETYNDLIYGQVTPASKQVSI